MHVNQWQKLERIFNLAVALPEPERADFVANECDGDAVLQEEILSLLSEDLSTDDFLEEPVFSLGSQLLIEADSIELLRKQRFGNYRLQKLLGRGGMGAVFLAEDLRLERLVALKILPSSAADSSAILRFQQEAKVASGVSHPNVAHIYDFGLIDERYFLAMEYVRGKTLRSLLKGRALNLREAVDIVLQIGNALIAAHKAGIIHRDIKPENIIINDDGLAKVLDFGIAKLIEDKRQTASSLETTPGLIVGTTAYMSPEQVRAQSLNTSSDIWSLGICLYEILAGTRPFDGETPSDIQAAILLKTLPPLPAKLKYRNEFTAILQKTLHKDWRERYQTASEFIKDLASLQAKINGGLSEDRRIVSEASFEWLWKAVVPLLLAISVGSIAILSTGMSENFFGGETKSAHFAETAKIESLAVLPFRNETGDEKLGFLSEGLAEDLTRNLGSLNLARVIAFSSSRKMREAEKAEIKNKLGAATVLSGAVVREGERLSVVIELAETGSEKVLWRDRISAANGDLLKLRNALTVVISTNLQNLLGGEKKLVLSEYSTHSNEAYRAYLEGKYGKVYSSAAETRRSIEILEKAVALDPNYAAAYVALADAYNLLGTWFGESPDVYQPKAKQTIEKALALDESLAEAHTTLAKIKMDYERDWLGAEREFKRAIEINPNHARAHHWYGEVYLSAMGRLDESIRELKIARSLDPLSSGVLTGLAWAQIGAGNYDEAIEMLMQGIALTPNDSNHYAFLAMAEWKRGNCDAAIKAGKRIEELNGDSVELGVISAQCGKNEEARRILQHFDALALKDKNVSDYTLAVLSGALGDRDRAFELLNREVNSNSVDLLSIKIDPLLDPLRNDERFAALVKRFNFPE